MKLQNDTFLRALRREPTDYTPVWMMRQAGRYLPEYNRSRARAGSFLELCRNTDFAVEVTLQPIDRFPLDAAILFSDILTVPDAMGLGLSFVAGEGPVFARAVRGEADVAALRVPDPGAELRYPIDAAAAIHKALGGRVPLIGFSGSPFTLACYMVEGRGSRDWLHLKTMLYTRPDLLHRILDVNARSVADYLNAQIAAGVEAVQIFDTWGGFLADAAFDEFSLRYTRQVIESLKPGADGRRVPVIVFTKGGGVWLERISRCGADCVGVDWTTGLGWARAQVADRVSLQGNMDPAALFGTEETIRREVRRVVEDFGPVAAGGHVFNLGHGVDRRTPPEAVAIAVDEAHACSRAMHAR